jgi:2-polyprenyl-6-methoxyphenol hydroxylase-like FAD-dependent oxidoreductase
MRFVVAGGGFAGLSIALAVARAGHTAVVLERDTVEPEASPANAFAVPRKGIPHFLQPHAFLPRGRKELGALAPDVLDALMDAGADPQDLREHLSGPPAPGDEDLVYLWVRRPVIEWALRRAAAAEPGVELRLGVRVAGLLIDEGSPPRATGVALDDGDEVRGDLVVDALGRYKTPPGWPRAEGTPTDCGAVYYCRYFELADGAEHLEGGPTNPLNPRGDLGYMGFNTFRGDNRTFSVIMLCNSSDRELRALKTEAAWMAAASAMKPLDVMTSRDHARPITDVLPMGELKNVERTGHPGVASLVAVGDALCHTDPAFSWGLAFSLAHARALAQAADEAPDVDAVAERYLDLIGPEARERHALACEMDEARAAHWDGVKLDASRADGCYPLFSFLAALAASKQDDHVLRRTIRRVGLLDRTEVFDADTELHARIETILAERQTPPPPAGPPRDELLALIHASTHGRPAD